jgi:glycosyltransferase involved in cell wall biosynthesis
MRRPRTVCLVPVRNAAHELSGFLESVTRVVDDVIALDDGSNDCTREMLEADPRVRIVLTNPPRPGYQGWDDGANRARLFGAAVECEPDWVLWLDADERLPPDDAAVLREFLATDALPGCAYGLQHYRMWGDGFDPDYMWIYRLVSFRPGQQLTTRRLHFSPIPTDIPRTRWVRTTIRVQHHGARDEASRRAHVAKYEAADPAEEFGRNFGGLAETPSRVTVWRPRDRALPVLAPLEAVPPVTLGDGAG